MLARLRHLAAAAASPRWRRRLGAALVPLLLWAVGYEVFRHSRPQLGRTATRIDWPGAVAYPSSDAGCDFQNGLALLSGDGWVNWRIRNRWSVYKPGWGATLGLLAALTGRDTGTMQWLITLGLSTFVPILYCLLLTLFPGPRGPPVAALATLLFIIYPPDQNWWFMRQMMTEGPSLLLGLCFCWLALELRRLPAAAPWPAIALGMIGGYANLVRGQARYAVLAVLVVLVVSRLRRPRRAARLAALFLVGFVAVVGPLYLKTSIHLGQPYFGTSYHALITMLDWTGPGKALGGSRAAIAGVDGEGAQLAAMSRLVGVAARQNLARGWRWLGDAVRISQRSLFPGLRRLVRLPRPGGLELGLLAAMAVGLWVAIRHHRLEGLVPFAFWAGYLAPNALFSYYLPRFGVPVAWVGFAYVTGALMAWVSGSPRPAVAADEDAGVAAPDPAASFPLRPLAVTAVWLAVATAVLLWVDLRPRPEVDVGGLLSHPRTRWLLEERGVELDAALRGEIEAAVNADAPSDRVRVGVAHLPLVMRPGQPAMRQGWKELEPAGEEPYTVFLLMSPWKEDDSLELSVVALPRQLYRGFRHGDRVVVVLSQEMLTPAVTSFLPTLQAAAAFPVRWPEPSPAQSTKR